MPSRVTKCPNSVRGPGGHGCNVFRRRPEAGLAVEGRLQWGWFHIMPTCVDPQPRQLKVMEC